VVPHYADLVSHVASGPSVYLKVSGGRDVVEDLRETVGPGDVQLAKTLRPKSLRARYGTNRVSTSAAAPAYCAPAFSLKNFVGAGFDIDVNGALRVRPAVAR